MTSSPFQRPACASLASTPTVTPPAGSVKMPSVRARRRTASTISSSVTASTTPPVSRAMRTTYGPSEGLPIAIDRAMVSGRTGATRSVPAFQAPDLDHVGLEDGGRDHLSLFQVVGHEDEALEARPGGVGSHRVGEVSRRRAADGLEPVGPSPRDRHRHHPVLEGVGGVHAVVLD